MKTQALALGAALGFLVAIAPSCGPTNCSAANCGGCCKDNKCVDKPNNSLNTTCGTSGNSCQDCSAMGSTCDATTFTCKVTGTGGGATGGGSAGGMGGGTAACDGCRLANGTCQPKGTSRQSNNICGANGETCHACAAPTPVCDMGVCIAPPKAVGDSCTADDECKGTLGPTAICKQQTAAGNFNYSGGTCTIPSCTASSCPMDSICINLPRVFGEEQAFCMKSNCGMSGTQGTCRSGYVCLGVSQAGDTACLVLDMFVNGAGANFDAVSIVGNPCTNNAACRAPTTGAPGAGGFCVTEYALLPDGGPRLLRDGGLSYSGFSQGYCSRDCRADNDCVSAPDEDFNANDSEAMCLPVSTTASSCLKACADPNLGRSGCRDSYVCEPLFLRDGGLYTYGVCQPACSFTDGGMNPGVTCGALDDGGAGGCDVRTGYCISESRDLLPNRPDGGTDGGAGGGAAGGGSAGGGAAGGGAAGGGAAGGGSAGGGAAGGGAAGGGAAGGGSATCHDGGAFVDGGCE